MAHLGIFSSLIPYIALVVSYITCVGYFSFNKKGVIEESDVNELFVDNNDNSDSIDCYSFFTDQTSDQKQSLESANDHAYNFKILNSKIRHVGNHSTGVLLNDFQSCLYSRPPPFFVC